MNGTKRFTSVLLLLLLFTMFVYAGDRYVVVEKYPTIYYIKDTITGTFNNNPLSSSSTAQFQANALNAKSSIINTVVAESTPPMRVTVTKIKSSTISFATAKNIKSEVGIKKLTYNKLNDLTTMSDKKKSLGLEYASCEKTTCTVTLPNGNTETYTKQIDNSYLLTSTVETKNGITTTNSRDGNTFTSVSKKGDFVIKKTEEKYISPTQSEVTITEGSGDKAVSTTTTKLLFYNGKTTPVEITIPGKIDLTVLPNGVTNRDGITNQIILSNNNEGTGYTSTTDFTYKTKEKNDKGGVTEVIKTAIIMCTMDNGCGVYTQDANRIYNKIGGNGPQTTPINLGNADVRTVAGNPDLYVDSRTMYRTSSDGSVKSTGIDITKGIQIDSDGNLYQDGKRITTSSDTTKDTTQSGGVKVENNPSQTVSSTTSTTPKLQDLGILDSTLGQFIKCTGNTCSMTPISLDNSNKQATSMLGNAFSTEFKLGEFTLREGAGLLGTTYAIRKNSDGSFDKVYEDGMVASYNKKTMQIEYKYGTSVSFDPQKFCGSDKCYVVDSKGLREVKDDCDNEKCITPQEARKQKRVIDGQAMAYIKSGFVSTVDVLDAGIGYGNTVKGVMNMFNSNNNQNQEYMSETLKDIADAFDVNSWSQAVCEMTTDESSPSTAAYLQDGTIGLNLNAYRVPFKKNSFSCESNDECNSFFTKNDTYCDLEEESATLNYCLKKSDNSKVGFNGFVYKATMMVEPSIRVIREKQTLKFYLTAEGGPNGPKKIDIGADKNAANDKIELKSGAGTFTISKNSGIYILSSNTFTKICMNIEDVGVFTTEFKGVFDKVGSGNKFCNDFTEKAGDTSFGGVGMFTFGMIDAEPASSTSGTTGSTTNAASTTTSYVSGDYAGLW